MRAVPPLGETVPTQVAIRNFYTPTKDPGTSASNTGHAHKMDLPPESSIQIGSNFRDSSEMTLWS
jgi:hypothetical protein